MTMTDRECAATARVLRDLDNNLSWLWGRVARFDVSTGRPLLREQLEFAPYQGFRPKNLPDHWEQRCAVGGLIVWDPTGTRGIPRWVVSDAGRTFAARWLPDNKTETRSERDA